ncbi:MAG: glycosyltransferase family 4 protein [Balneolaceae bacterium]|nr:glycosyltransferase family 4 protein [Balneolaceae bacterium]
MPDLVTLKSKVTPEIAAEKYNMDVHFRVREILTDVRIPYEWHIILFNKISQNYLQDYDLVINHNNTSFLYKRPEAQKMVSYVHFPRKARGISNAVSIHRPNGPKKKWYHFRSDAFKLSSLAYRFDTAVDPEERYLANSEYTKQVLLDHYDLPSDQIEVLYPPVGINGEMGSAKKDESLIITLGRFSPEKRQLEQLKIARKLPQLNFKIMGFLSNQDYFRRCIDYLNDHQIKNAELMPNLPYDTLMKILDRAGLFLHSLQNEPFGITTVEAISHGCIPIVPDSGGQKEIVPIEELRYGSSSEAVKLIAKAAKKSEEEKDRLRNHLFEGIRQFETPNFEEQFNNLLNQVLK